MGRKKPQKTKELSVAIAEATSSATAAQEAGAKHPLAAPRKRGRPRKINIIPVEKTETKQQEEEEQEGSKASEEDKSGEKKVKPGEEGGGAEEDKEDQQQSEDKGRPVTRSRARRKSYMPRKSS